MVRFKTYYFGICWTSLTKFSGLVDLWKQMINLSLYPPSERSELARYHVMLFSVLPSVCAHSVFRCKYLENGLS